jgi:hypothetical protein
MAKPTRAVRKPPPAPSALVDADDDWVRGSEAGAQAPRRQVQQHPDTRGKIRVIAWADWYLSNAALEGNNARIRGLSQRAHGYRNPSNLMHAIYVSSFRS